VIAAASRGRLLAVEQLEQVGDVGRVQRLDQLVDAGFVALFERGYDRIDELRLEPVVLVELVAVIVRRGGLQLGEVLLGHRGRVYAARAQKQPGG